MLPFGLELVLGFCKLVNRVVSRALLAVCCFSGALSRFLRQRMARELVMFQLFAVM
jgi:hypothetical protein